MTDRDAAFERQKQRQGKDLLALVMSWQLGVTHRTALKNMGDGDVDPSWGELAWELQRNLVEGVAARRREARSE